MYSFECILADEEVALVGSKYGLDHLTKEMIIVDEENQIMRETAAKKLLRERLKKLGINRYESVN